MSEFTKEYFIKKFKAIPNELWTIADLTKPTNGECHCALGHCGVTYTPENTYLYTDEAKALSDLLADYHFKLYGFKADEQQQNANGCQEDNVWRINDETIKLSGTPKSRILTALKSI